MRNVLLLLGALSILAAPALAQEATVVRDGTTLTVTLPDGTVQTFTLAADAPLRIRVEDGEVEVEREWDTGDVIYDGPEKGDIRTRRERRVFRLGDGRTRDLALRHRRPHGDGDVESEIDGEAVIDSLAEALPRLRAALTESMVALRDGEVFEVLGDDGSFGAMAGASAETRRAEREGDAAEAERLHAELAQTLGEVFDLKQQARREALDRLREERAEQEAALAERERNRRAIVERRQRELLGEDDAFDW